MKQLIRFLFILVCTSTFGQANTTKILEQRAKDFHLAISKNDKEVWRKFMDDNFTRALIERPMRAQVSTSENDGSSNASTSETRTEEKLTMFQQLHKDFGSGKIRSITVTGNSVKMVVTAGSLNGIFSLEAESKKPWLIDRMGIEVEAEH